MKFKTSSLCLIVLTSSLLSTNLQAQLAVPNSIQVTPEMIERGKGLAKGFGKKIGKKAAIEGAKKVAPVAIVPLIFKPKKTLATATVLAAGAGAGFWWYSTTIPYAVKKLAKDPTDFEVYWDNLGDDFDKKLEFAQTTWDLYYENTGEEQKKYEDLIVLLGYERPSLLNNLASQVVTNQKTKVEQEDLEKTNEFTLAMAEVDALATQMDLQYEPLCRGQLGQQIREQLFKLTPKDFAQLPLIKNNMKTANFLNVDSYGLLLKDGVFLENDHIPSYEALAKFFKIPVIKVKNQKIRDLNLNQNATALSIPKIMHKNNRTWGKGNIKL